MSTDPPSETTTFFMLPNGFLICYIYVFTMIRCPVCMSRDIYRVAGGYIGEIHRCKRCGYVGAFVIEEAGPGPGDQHDTDA